MLVYFKECRVSGEQYTSSMITKFGMIVKNYKRTYRYFCGGKRLPNQAHKVKSIFMSIIFQTAIMKLTTDKIL